jgi:hypothetical protein
VREDAEVKRGCFFGIVVEPKEWREFVHREMVQLEAKIAKPASK